MYIAVFRFSGSFDEDDVLHRVNLLGGFGIFRGTKVELRSCSFEFSGGGGHEAVLKPRGFCYKLPTGTGRFSLSHFIRPSSVVVDWNPEYMKKLFLRKATLQPQKDESCDSCLS